MKRIWILCLGLLTALATLGAGYAYYTQNMFIDGSVTTASWGGHTDPEDPDDPDIPDWTPEGFSVIVCGRAPDGTFPNGFGAYPGYVKTVNFSFTNPSPTMDMKIVAAKVMSVPAGLWELPLPGHGPTEPPGSTHTVAFRMENGSTAGQPNMRVDSTLGPQDVIPHMQVVSASISFTIPPELTDSQGGGGGLPPNPPTFRVIFTFSQLNDP